LILLVDEKGIATLAANVDALKMDINAKFIDLKMGMSPHHGVTTEAEFTKSLRINGQLKLPTENNTLRDFLENCSINTWIAHGELVMNYPAIGVGENDHKNQDGVVVPGTRSYVTGMLNEIKVSTLLYTQRARKKGDVQHFNKSKSTAQKVVECYVDPDAHKRPSFGTRKPDVVVYAGSTRGSQDIVLLGDVIGRGFGDFSDDQIGHVLDFGTALMKDYQVGRRKLYVFLTDGYRFQFFSISRDENVEGRWSILQSSVYVELLGWQVSLLEYEYVETHSLQYVFADLKFIFNV
jgi:hypothetical protein